MPSNTTEERLVKYLAYLVLYVSSQVIGLTAATGAGIGSSDWSSTRSRGGGALFSPRFSSNHLSMSSDLLNGRLPRSFIMSSLKPPFNTVFQWLIINLPSNDFLLKQQLSNLLNIFSMFC